MKHQLLGEDRLARARMSHDNVDGVQRKSATEDVVGLGVARGHPVGHIVRGPRYLAAVGSGDRNHCGSVKECASSMASRRIVPRSTDGTSGFRGEGFAPASFGPVLAGGTLK